MNEEHLNRYARLLVGYAAGLRPGQPLFIAVSVDYRHLGLRVGEIAYQVGGGQVRYRFFDPLEVGQLIRHGRRDQITLYHVEIEAWFNEILRTRGALILLHAVDEPEVMPELARTHVRNHEFFACGMSAASLAFQSRALQHGLCPVVNAPVPSPVWARRLFPELPEAAATDRLAELIFHFVGADQPDALERAVARERQLKARAAELNQLRIREIHIAGGGNDLRIGLSEKARWWGGSVRTAAGQDFHFNVPTFEVFTTPECRRTAGRLVATRPIRLRTGALVDGLVLEFRDGRVVDFQASEGADCFARWLASDDGARALGEFALVGEDSPIARSGLSFDYYIFDENAASHVALGEGQVMCLAGGEMMTPHELEAEGCNRSASHLDIPFGSPEVRIVATKSRDGEVVVLERGLWARFDARESYEFSDRSSGESGVSQAAATGRRRTDKQEQWR